ncbi:hypothetical protein IJ843_05500 [bacterium]|nr:hypothetical protein [bacterium]
MTSPITSQPNIRIGMCPHGLPQSSCPICSKQTGGGMMSSSSVKNSRPSNEWSYQKCYVAGLEIRAAMQRKEAAQNFYEKQFQTALSINRNLQNITDKLNSFIQNIKSPNVQASMQFLMNSVVNPLFNTLSQISSFIDKVSKMPQNALNMILQAGEKVTTIIGEIKNFVDRKIIDDLKKKAKKFMSFCLSVIEDENYQNDETLAVFKSRELKKYIVKILKKPKDDEHGNNQDK